MSLLLPQTSGRSSCSTRSGAELHPAVNLATLNVLLADREASKCSSQNSYNCMRHCGLS